MLKVKNLVKIYKIAKSKESVVALNKVSIDFPETGLVFLLGKSGSGKSTLLNAIGGLDTFDSGEIIIKGRSSKDFSQADFDSYRNTFIGFIFQEYNILEEFTVAKNLSIALELQGKKADKEEVERLLEQVDMLEYAKRKPNQLSGGQKQRVAIARALIKNPEIIMADEPTGALDSNTGKQVMETLKKLSKEKLVVIVSHDREFAEIYGDRIIELKDGKIIQDVTKKEIESQKTKSGVSLIDDKIIHIKKGVELTNEDISKINAILKNQTSKSDVIISIDDSANEQVKKANFITADGNKETFCPTTEGDVPQKPYNPKDFKLIKSQLKFKDSFKMGASALKNKVAKLVFTIMLSFIAFAMFGIIDTFSSFNRAGAIFHTVEQFNQKTISILKEEEGKYSNKTSPFKEADIDIIKEKFPDIELKKIVGADISFGQSYWSNSYNKQLQIENLNNSSSNPANTPYYSGMIHLKQNELSSYGLSLLPGGRLPTNDNEICISKHIFECFKALNSSENLTYDTMLTTYKECIIGYNYNNKYTIVGIIDDGSNYSEYMNMESSQINSDYLLQQQISRELDFGFCNMIYITENKYNGLLSEPISMNLNVVQENSSSSFNVGELKTLKDGYYEYIEYYLNEWINEKGVTFKNGAIFNNNNFANINDNEILIHSDVFDILFGTTDQNRNTVLYGTTPLTVNICTSNDVPYQYDTVVKTYTVVGYFLSGSYNFIFASDTTSAEIEALGEQYTNGLALRKDNNVTDGYNNYNASSFKQKFFNDRNWVYTKEQYVESYVEFYKDGSLIDSNGNFKELSENEIIVNEHLVSHYGQGEELENVIRNGLTIDICKDYEGKKVVATLTVVGISSNYMYVSNDTITNTFNSILSGFDYAIAKLSDNNSTNEKFINFCETFNDEGIKYTVQTGATPILDNFGDIFNTLSEVLLYVGIGFAVFASLLLMNFISTSISYKKREIGILRALGARGSDVFGIFFNESCVIALINFALATLATIITCGILNNVIITKLGLDLVLLSVGIRQIALMLGISLLAAFLASIIPVSKISRKKPIDAINNR